MCLTQRVCTQEEGDAIGAVRKLRKGLLVLSPALFLPPFFSRPVPSASSFAPIFY